MLNDLHKLVDFRAHKTILSESQNIDGSFLIHHALSLCLKNSRKTLFLTLAQTFSHYKSVQNKFGNSPQIINKAIEEANLINIDILSKVTKVNDGSNILLHSIQQDLNNKIHINGYTHLIIDDLSVLYLLGCSTYQIFKFIKDLRCNSKDLHMILNINLFDDNDELSVMSKNLVYMSNVCFYVSHLKTGYSKDIQGQVAIHKCNYPFGNSKDLYLYKTSDRNVTLHAIGSIV